MKKMKIHLKIIQNQKDLKRIKKSDRIWKMNSFKEEEFRILQIKDWDRVNKENQNYLKKI